ncbi:class I SAM-dependent methyltransferase [Geodermatophilus sp. DF01-2]|uniref:class I SAM-dependent methyltransferase n=1 Tax=Geodermatophilus sp. DF01-2 TaxID=2559610 RepID=UPI0014314646|nr:class I SAM-dependent methyltransferase [Geodermatophilus sp. DF01_2]
MGGAFASSTAGAYRRVRRDVPAPVLDRLMTHLGVVPADRAVDLGAGTGQVAVPLAARLAGVLALDPEPDMLVQLRRRAEDDHLTNVVCALAVDVDLPALTRAIGSAGFGLLTVANALHWMNAGAVFTAARRLLRPGGGIAVITHGRPLWLGERDWARALRGYLEDWFGPARAGCGTDEETLLERRRLLEASGFVDVAVLEHHFSVPVDADFVIGTCTRRCRRASCPTTAGTSSPPASARRSAPMAPSEGTGW